MTDNLIRLNRAGVSVLISTASQTPIVLYWGAELSAQAADDQYLLADVEPTLHGNLDSVHSGGAWRENARGFWGRPSVLGHRSGRDWSALFEIVSEKHDAHSATFISRDSSLQLEVEIRYELNEFGVLFVDHKITNLGDDYTLDNSIVSLPLPESATDVIDYTGRWLKERQPQRMKINTGSWIRDSYEGRSGHDYTIVQFAATADANFNRGEVWGMSLAWSGQARHMVERQPMGFSQIAAGELLMPGEVILTKGESYEAPRVIATYSNSGIDGASHRLHQWIRSRKNHPTNIRPRPVSLNVWEAVYMDHDLGKLTELAKVAGEVGIERFVLDDGWFGARRDDRAGLGDWVISKDVWPNGFDPLIDVVKANGMEFGLWFEGEMVNPDSDLYRAHPDWILHTADRVPIEARNQHVLNLSIPECFEHVLGQVDAVLSDYDIRYIKWDHNRTFTDASSAGRASVRNQTIAIYRLFDELKLRHPGLEIESCASGGGRIDLGMIDHADRFWTSDDNDPIERQTINRYTSIAIPPEMLGTHIGPTKSHTTGKTNSISFRALTALWGHAGMEWDITETTTDERKLLREFTDYYKANRDLLHSGRVVRLESVDGDAWTHGVVAQDGKRAIFAYIALGLSTFSLPPKFTLGGLDDASIYEVKLKSLAGDFDVVQKTAPGWASGIKLDGKYLQTIGLRPPVLKPESGFLVEVTKL